MTDMMNEGIGGPAIGGLWSWSGILAYTVDMYGGVGGQMAQGGITGMPSPGDGGTGSVIPGADGGSSTPENRDNQLLSPNGLPVPAWTPHGSLNPNDISNLYETALRQIAAGAAIAPRQVNSGLWGVPGYKWVGKFPVPTQQAKADKYQTMPPKHRVGPKVDPYFEIAPSIDWTNDFNILDNPYEYENWPFPDNQITPIGDVVTFPGNPANDNNPTGPGGAPHNWDNYRRQEALARAIAQVLQGNLGQGYFFGP